MRKVSHNKSEVQAMRMGKGNSLVSWKQLAF